VRRSSVPPSPRILFSLFPSPFLNFLPLSSFFPSSKFYFLQTQLTRTLTFICDKIKNESHTNRAEILGYLHPAKAREFLIPAGIGEAQFAKWFGICFLFRGCWLLFCLLIVVLFVLFLIFLFFVFFFVCFIFFLSQMREKCSKTPYNRRAWTRTCMTAPNSRTIQS
jgi:hypothetical protein